MPQLTPFYFTGEVIVTFIIITTLIIIFSKYVLPSTIRTQISRIFLTTKKN